MLVPDCLETAFFRILDTIALRKPRAGGPVNQVESIFSGKKIFTMGVRFSIVPLVVKTPSQNVFNN